MPPASEARRVQARRAFCVTGVLQPMPGIGLDTFESDLIRFQLIPSTRIPPELCTERSGKAAFDAGVLISEFASVY